MNARENTKDTSHNTTQVNNLLETRHGFENNFLMCSASGDIAASFSKRVERGKNLVTENVFASLLGVMSVTENVFAPIPDLHRVHGGEET
jgi:hypothetical protein